MFSKLSEDELDGIVEEVDVDGSGTLDFDGEQCCGSGPAFFGLSGPRFHKMKGADRTPSFFRVAGSTDPNRDVERERIWIRFSAGLDPI